MTEFFAPFEQLFNQSPALLITTVGILGALVGSFLNVVISRLPEMLMREWKKDCCELLESPAPENADEKFNLMWPSSRCPKCSHAIKWYENIPVLSYLFLLKGKCSGCKTPISMQYPFVEALTAVLSVLVAIKYGFTPELGFVLVLTWSFVALTFIDLKHMLLPDNIVLPLIWLGLIASTMGYFLTPSEAIISAAIGYLSLWSIYWAFKLLTGKEGMGYGDFKLLAAICAFTGAIYLPLILIISSVSGAFLGIYKILKKDKDEESPPIPFGPFLAIGGWITLMWGEPIAAWYLGTL